MKRQGTCLPDIGNNNSSLNEICVPAGLSRMLNAETNLKLTRDEVPVFFWKLEDYRVFHHLMHFRRGNPVYQDKKSCSGTFFSDPARALPCTHALHELIILHG
jgi:hypothetical protein